VNEQIGSGDWTDSKELGSTWEGRNSFSYGRQTASVGKMQKQPVMAMAGAGAGGGISSQVSHTVDWEILRESRRVGGTGIGTGIGIGIGIGMGMVMGIESDGLLSQSRC
jgi:hypothetical protein